MTSSELSARRDHWLRAVGYGFLAEAATVVTIILIVTAYRFAFARGLSDSDYTAFGERTGEIVGIIGGTLYTYLFARLLMRVVRGRFIAHGIVLALTAIAFSIGGSIAGHRAIPPVYLLASLLKLAGGAIAGLLYFRSASLNRNVV